jgi:predicted helicase
VLESYIKSIYEVGRKGDATEPSYYPSLAGLLKEFSGSVDKKHIQITILPKKTEAGNPDFRVWDGKQSIVGYIEAKPPTVENLDYIETTDQLKRYRNTFPNLILTNFFEFRCYRDGKLIDKVSIGKSFVLHQLKTIPPIENQNKFLKFLEQFFAFSLPKTYSAKSLAIELAKKTSFLKEQVVIEELREEEEKGSGFILGFYEAFQKYLIGGLTKEAFADLYAQTVTYGLFAARTRCENGFNRKLAYDYIPETIGILRDVFEFISLGKLPQQMECTVDDISAVLAVADANKILHQFYREGKGKDPIVHFYETFLAEYDPKERERRGVYYTPEAVVSYIVRSLNIVLKERFSRADGLASGSVTVLDPAAGTLTFLAEASKLAVQEFVSKYGEGGKHKFIGGHILRDFYAFELMMAPYAVGHLKMSFLLEELGYKLQKDERFKLYLTNTLEMEELEQTALPGMSSLAEESHLAGRVKKETPILVILGNPPYSGHSANIGEWISKEIKTYYQVDGKPLGEKNPKWLQDDYVKFIRFAQWKIDAAGEGILGFITNHSYLDNPTFRGMRQSLMNSFDEIYLLDLHGNSLKKERCPDGSKDENVFDIQQGVAIALFVKKKGLEKKIFHSERWGLQEVKEKWLLKNDIKATSWQEIQPKSEFYLFIPRDEILLDTYNRYPRIINIFPLNSVGVVTARDDLTIKWSKEEVWNTVLNFVKLDTELARAAYNLGKDARDWKVEFAKADLNESGLDKKLIIPIIYRPFDIRYTYYTGKSRGFHCMPRSNVMRHMMKENLGLLTCRQQNTVGFYHALVCKEIVESCIVSNNTREISYLFPLYSYPVEEKEQPDKSGGREGGLQSVLQTQTKREANLSLELMKSVAEAYGEEPTPEAIFYYIYGILYSNSYRSKYAEFLKTDFPRVPFTKHHDLFIKIGALGKRLVDLHLMKSSELNNPTARLRGNGDCKVEKPSYNREERRIYINKSQYFEGVEEKVWEYKIGGYQVAEKWLKERKGRVLSIDDIKNYCRVITALKKTIEIQKDIDALYPNVETEIVLMAL